MRRFFSAAPITDSTAILADDEAHHLLHVVRVEVGDEVLLFDGSGAEYLARVARRGKREVELEIVSRAEVSRELPREIVLGIALPKGDRQKWLVEKGVELGAARLVPLECERGVAQPQPQVLERLRRAVIEASKQCGRNRLLQISPAAAWGTWKSQVPPSAAKFVAHPGDALAASPLTPREWMSHVAATTGPIYLAIGPEGGFSAEEIAAALAAGWRCLSLGRRILRVETAALAALALLAGAVE